MDGLIEKRSLKLMSGGVEEGNDDYMGNLSQFLPPQPQSLSSQSVSTSKVETVSVSNKKFKARNWQEQKRLKQEQKQIVEDQKTITSLDSAIPQSNIGFKLLKKMGYTPGSGLGKEMSGRAEPIRLEIRRGRGGIGKADPHKEKLMKEKEKTRREEEKGIRDKRKVEEMLQAFGSRQKERWKGKRIGINFRKAEAALAQLENRDVIEFEKKEEDDEEKKEEEEITEKDLLNILQKLRNEFNYCLFCGFQYESEEALASNCPGMTEGDH